MTTTNYISLCTSNNSLQVCFPVIMGTREPYLTKMQTNERTLGGRLDSQEGPIPAAHALQVFCHNVAHGEAPDSPSDLPANHEWGVLDDLKTLYRLTNPRGTPSNHLTYVDHAGVSHTVKLTGELRDIQLSPVVDGPDSWYTIALTMEEVG